MCRCQLPDWVVRVVAQAGLNTQGELLAAVSLIVNSARVPQSRLARLTGVSQSVISRIASSQATRTNASTTEKLRSCFRSGYVRVDGGDGLTLHSLDWALLHVERQRDTDLFPRPFEFHSIHDRWPVVRAALAAVDLDEYSPGESRTFLVPKGGPVQEGGLVGLRRATQLDPLDSLVYAAMVFEVAQIIDASRVPRDVVCGYRVAEPEVLAESGVLYRSGDRKVLAEQAREAAAGARCVLVADITDFYNQISDKKLQQALEDAGIKERRARNMVQFLARVRDHAPTRGIRGIPVGPHPSALLAECTLTEVDRFLQRSGAKYVRLNDDFRIFCNSEAAARRLHYALYQHLSGPHGLTLNEKTRIAPVAEALDGIGEGYCDRPAPREVGGTDESDAKNWLAELLANISVAGFQTALDRLLDGEHLSRAYMETLLNNMPACAIHDQLLRLSPAQWDLFVPVAGDFVRYLMRDSSGYRSAEIGKHLLSWVDRDSAYAHVPYLKLWAAEAVTTTLASGLGHEADSFCETLARQEPQLIGLRPLAKLAAKRNQRDWLRSQGHTWSARRTWERRPMIHAARALSATERAAWQAKATSLGLVEAVLALNYLSGSGSHGLATED